ncbi:hypothetical protein M9H77_11561 [Catharanthus roseus]|uniref:Uncharacterized protein n=1 Tax=Catharanthus roseus TaxID=4058 RepID=A0ACC0BEX7_CATRO|nr:hypothetical protein M9H77_11561 [Catharanthus roseus]
MVKRASSSQSTIPKLNTITVERKKIYHESVRGTYLSLQCRNPQWHTMRLNGAEQRRGNDDHVEVLARQKVPTLMVKMTLRSGLKEKISLALTLSLTLMALATKR